MKKVGLLVKMTLLSWALLLFAGSLKAQEESKTDSMKVAEKEQAKKGLPLLSDRSFRLKTDEASWICLDVSPDGQQIAFGVLGDLYLLPISGGKAKRITEGLAYDTHPRFSPDGQHLAFSSDRDGNENLWIMELATGDSTQITKEKTDYLQAGEWTPDGQYLIVSRGRRNNKLFMYHKDGGSGVPLIKEPDNLKTIEPAFGAEENILWFARRSGDWQYNAQLPQYQLATYDRETGEIDIQTNRYGSAFSPTLSPDGQWLVYGSRYNTETGLVKRNLKTGQEDWLAYPVQRDDQEARSRLGVYPAMSFTPDSKFLIASYGGKIHKLPIDGGKASLIPFEIDEDIALGPEVRFEYPIEDGPEMDVTQIRDAVISPNGKQLAFTALNRLYIMDYPNGEARRLTNADYTEAMPCWSPDSRQIAYVTWSENEGHIYKINASGSATPTQITTESAIYSQPAWDAKSNRIVFLYGPTQSYQDAVGPFSFRSQEKMGWVSANGGAVQFIREAGGRGFPHFVEKNDRIYCYHGQKGLLSMRWDGTDEKAHLKVTGITTFPALILENHKHGHSHDVPSLFHLNHGEPKQKPSNASVLMMAPKGDKALALINNDVYVVTVPMVGKEAPTISVADIKSAAFPAWKLTKFGGEFPQWSSDASKVNWSLGNAWFSYDLAEGERVAKELEEEKKRKAAEEKANKDKDKEGEKKGEEEEDKSYKAKEIRVKVVVKKDVPQGKIVFKNVRIITMKGKEIIEKGDVVVENARIVAVGPSGSVTIPRGAKVMDMTGKTIVPGYVDTHAHMWPNWGIHKNQIWMYAANLAFGVTTTRDPQTATTDVLTYADMVDAGMLLGPRVYSTGPGVGFWAYNIKSLDHARDVLKQYSEYYNTKTIKMYMTGNRQHRQWIVQAAKEQNLMPTTEGALDFKLNLTQVLDGYPGHEHAFPIYPLYKDVLELMKVTNTAYTPTLLVAYGGPWAENYYYATEDLQADERLQHFTPKVELDYKTRRRPGWFMPEEHIFSRHAEFVKTLMDEDGMACVGSHGQLQGLGYHWELWAMQSGGLSTHEALRTATIKGAEAIGLQKDLGSIEPGKIADLLILDSNPIDNIRFTKDIRYVMKNGRLYESDSLDEVYPNQREAPEYYWQGGAPTGLPGISR